MQSAPQIHKSFNLGLLRNMLLCGKWSCGSYLVFLKYVVISSWYLKFLSCVGGGLKQYDILGKHVQSLVDVGPSSPASPQETGQSSEPSHTLDSGEQALLRLISGALPQDEQALIIESVFSSQKVTNMVNDLQEQDAQTFIDVIHEVCYHSSISNRVSWMVLLLAPFHLCRC